MVTKQDKQKQDKTKLPKAPIWNWQIASFPDGSVKVYVMSRKPCCPTLTKVDVVVVPKGSAVTRVAIPDSSVAVGIVHVTCWKRDPAATSTMMSFGQKVNRGGVTSGPPEN